MTKRNRTHFIILRLCVCAMLVAIGVVLSGLLSIPDFSLGNYTMKIGFGSLAPILAGVLYGPLYGGIVGGLVDLIQALLFPKGAFVPWFTVVAVLSGLIPGLFFIKRRRVPSFIRILLATFTGQVVCSVILNTLLIYLLYGSAFWVLLPKRLVNQAIMIPAYTVIIWVIISLFARTNLLYKFTDYPRPEDVIPDETVPDGSAEPEKEDPAQ